MRFLNNSRPRAALNTAPVLKTSREGSSSTPLTPGFSSKLWQRPISKPKRLKTSLSYSRSS